MTKSIIYQVGERLHPESRLTYVEDAESKPRVRKAKFLCECGNHVVTRVSGVKNGHTKSCGCYAIDKLSERFTTHGMCGTPTHGSWTAMIQRCTNRGNGRFKHYGGRGITVCKSWLVFENFYADMGDRPEGMTLDRKNNDEGYSKANCRWATMREQSRNTSQNRMLTFNGRTQCLSDWAADAGMKVDTLYARVVMYGWPVERSLTQCVGKYTDRAGI